MVYVDMRHSTNGMVCSRRRINMVHVTGVAYAKRTALVLVSAASQARNASRTAFVFERSVPWTAGCTYLFAVLRCEPASWIREERVPATR